MSAVAVKPAAALRSVRELLHGLISDTLLAQVPDQLIGGVSLDSRKQAANSMFVAVPGLRGHGIDHVMQAVNNGATVVLWEPGGGRVAPAVPGAVVVAIPQLSALLGSLADRFYGQPSQALRIAAVTGTNGKSTTAYLIAAAAERCGIAAGYSGTVGYGRIAALQPATHTTPDVFNVHRQLAELRDGGAQAVGMEVSSHALDQARVAAVRFDTAVFTNLSRDHLDYHGSMQAYGEAKALLFLSPGLRHRVINADDDFGRQLLTRNTSAALTTVYSCTTSVTARRVLQAQVNLSDDGLRLEISGSFGALQLRSGLLGRFNAENLLAALAVLLGWDIALPVAVQALQQAGAPPGRMERVAGAGKRAVIDYAHTPDALAKALAVLKQHTCGRIICVFGCGGDRDPGKRPQMGAIAARLADVVILTDDNPRTEDPLHIIAGIQAGMGNASAIVQRDRARAIEQALHLAHKDDVVLIAGKGHEDYQIIGADMRHFSDREVVQAVLGGAG